MYNIYFITSYFYCGIVFIYQYFPKNRCIKDEVTLQGAMEILEKEIVPWDDPSEASPEYRIHLTKSLLYKVGALK